MCIALGLLDDRSWTALTDPQFNSTAYDIETNTCTPMDVWTNTFCAGTSGCLARYVTC